MSTVTRLQLKAMMDSWGAFDTSVKLSENALAASKAKKYLSLTQLVHENYFKFDKDYRNYKTDIIEKKMPKLRKSSMVLTLMNNLAKMFLTSSITILGHPYK